MKKYRKFGEVSEDIDFENCITVTELMENREEFKS